MTRTNRTSSHFVWSFVLMILLLAGTAAGQTTSGTIIGIIQDPTGATVPQADVTIT